MMVALAWLAVVVGSNGASRSAPARGLVNEDSVQIDLLLRLLRSQATRSYVQEAPASPLDPHDIVGAVQEVAIHEAYVQEYMEIAVHKAMLAVRGDTGSSSWQKSRAQQHKQDSDEKSEESDDQASTLEKLTKLFGDLDANADAEKPRSKSQSRASKLANVDNVRKKDSPTELAGIMEQIQVQETQKKWVAERARSDKNRVIFAPAQALATPLNEKVECGERLYSQNWYSDIDGCTARVCQRFVTDNFATSEQADTLAKAVSRAMVGLFHQGGTTSLVPDSRAAGRLGRVGSQLATELRDRVRRQIMRDFDVDALYDSGALLTRLKADFEDDMYEVDHNHIYWNPHVDKANIASYDYSALLYLNSQGKDFDGGDFAFLDLDDDKIVAPIKGRLLTFTSGLENLHQVREVTRGTRLVLAMWFTCSNEHEYKESDG